MTIEDDRQPHVADESVVISCMRCGNTLHEPLSHNDCRPRFLYWWPRDHPYILTLAALVLGVVLGRLTTW